MCTVTKDSVKMENNLGSGCLDTSMLGQTHWSLTCEDTGYRLGMKQFLNSHVNSLITNVQLCGLWDMTESWVC